jgi:hypothetical protein
VKLEVIDKETSKVVWSEDCQTLDQALKAISQLKENNFNPDYFIYSIDGQKVN